MPRLTWNAVPSRRTAVLVLAASATAAFFLTRHATGVDLILLRKGLVPFVHHQPAYRASSWVDCLPSTMVLLAPFGAMSLSAAAEVMRLGSVVTLLATSWLALGSVFTKRVPTAAIVVSWLALCVFEPARAVYWLANTGVFASLLVVAALWYAVRNRWAEFGLALGLGLAIKPVTVPLVLLPVLYRQWRAASIAIAVPTALTGVALAISRQPSDFITLGVPRLLHGFPSQVGWSASLASRFEMAGTPTTVALAVRAAVVVSLIVAAVVRHRTGGLPQLVLIETAGLLITAVLLGSSFSWNHYFLFLAPVYASVVLPQAAMRWAPGATGIVLAAAPFTWLPSVAAHVPYVGPLLTGSLVLTASALARGVVRARRAQAAGSPSDAVTVTPAAPAVSPLRAS